MAMMDSEMKENVPVKSTRDDHTNDNPPISTSPTKESSHASPKRKVSENAVADHADAKKKRRKVNHACVYCRRSHMTCDLERPCARCVKRDIGHLCHDEPREPPKRSKSELGVADIAPAPEEGRSSDVKRERAASDVNGRYHDRGRPAGVVARINGNGADTTTIVQPAPLSPGRAHHRQSSSNINLAQAYDWSNGGLLNQFQDNHHLHPTFNMFSTHEVSQEYDVLNDFLNSNLFDGQGNVFGGASDPSMFGTAINVNGLAQDLNLPTVMGPPTQAQAGHEISRPSSAFPADNRAREKFYLTAADPGGSSSPEERLHKLLKAKYDAGMLKPFNYIKGYARLNQYMSKNLSKESQYRVLQQLNGFRPGFRKAMQNLNDMQLVLVEMWFERSLMEYDRVFASMAIPACCWRRTGEVFRANTEMAELIHQPLERLRDGKIAIHEIFAEDSLVSYWEKFGAIAFDPKQKAILTSCTLKRPIAPAPPHGADSAVLAEHARGPSEMVKCCFSFTIRRDSHNM
jgi:hypothetical protein